MPADHLDDDVINDAIDGVGPPAPAAQHLRSCPSCQARLARFADASQLVAAPVPPLDASVVDAIVGRTMAAAVVPVGAARRRQLRAVPPPWAVAVAAALTLVLGVPALLRATGGGSEDRASLSAGSPSGHDERSSSAAEGGATLSDSGVGAAGTGVGNHLGAVDSAEAVVASLRARLDVAQFESQLEARAIGDAAASSSGEAPAPVAKSMPEASDFRAGSPRSPLACTEEATVAAGDANVLTYAAEATWQGGPATVFVFALAQPADDGLRRQAYVLTVPSCDVVAAPRF